MKETVVHLIRHGSKNDPKKLFHKDSFFVPLSQEGALEMQDLGRKIVARDNLDAIYTSPYLRTVDSAHILAAITGRDIPVMVRPDLRESDSKGGEGLYRNILRGDFYDNPPQGMIIESPNSIATRITTAIAEIRERHEGRSVAIVGHADPLAFAKWRMLHTSQEFPSIQELYDGLYVPPKGSSWRIVLDEQNNVLREDVMRGEAIHIRRERE